MFDEFQKDEKNKQFSTMIIDYRHYERRARCLRSRMLLKWLGNPVESKNCSSEEGLCEN